MPEVGRRSRAKQERRAQACLAEGATAAPAVAAYKKALRKVNTQDVSLAYVKDVVGRGGPWFHAFFDRAYELRLERCERQPHSLLEAVLGVMASVPPLDAAAFSLGANPRRPPVYYGTDWSSHYAWGLDSIIAALRLLMAGQHIGAAFIARNQLERWLHHTGDRDDIRPEPHEAPSAYHDRLCLLMIQRHAMDASGAGASLQGLLAGRIFADLSEILHGRHLTDAIIWEAGATRTGPPPSVTALSATVLGALRWAVLLIRAGLANLGEGRDVQYSDMEALDLSVANPEPPPWNLLHPLDRLLIDDFRANRGPLREVSAYYASLGAWKRRTWRANSHDLPWQAFNVRRLRAYDLADYAAYEDDRVTLVTDDSSPSASPDGFYSATTELAGFIAGWSQHSEQQAAAALAASASRSSYWLWLEDDDRSMATLRVVLEMTAKLRVWRLKPVRAQKLHSNPSNGTGRWLEAAGWKYLAPLNRALGEMAHARGTPRWKAARQLLGELDPRPVTRGQMVVSGRGTALRNVMLLLYTESFAVAQDLDADLGEALGRGFEQSGLTDDYVKATLATWRRHMLSFDSVRIDETQISGPRSSAGGSDMKSP